jgi:hypothetical protein
VLRYEVEAVGAGGDTQEVDARRSAGKGWMGEGRSFKIKKEGENESG